MCDLVMVWHSTQSVWDRLQGFLEPDLEMEGWRDGGMGEWMNGWLNEWMDGCVDGWVAGWVDRKKGLQSAYHFEPPVAQQIAHTN